MKKIITTVGTSLFSNYESVDIKYLIGDAHRSIADELKKLKNKPVKDFNEPKYKNDINKIEEVIERTWLCGFKKGSEHWEETDKNKPNYDASAEIKSLYKLSLKYESDEIIVVLLATDTILSKLAANIICNKLTINNVKIHKPKVIDGLQVHDSEKFKTIGFNSLINTLKEIVSSDKKEDVEHILNISGGYKAIIPILTVFSQLYNIPAYYIYEESNTLLNAPLLPIQHDWGMAELFYPFLQPNILSKNNFDINESLILLRMINFSMITKEKQDYKITGWGKLYKTFIDEEHPIAKNTLGFFVEYKVYEYFIEHTYNNKYKYVKHSEKIDSKRTKKGKREFDIVLRSKANNNEDIIVSEIKSLLSFSSNRNFEEIKKQICNQITDLKATDIIPKEYILIIYSIESSNFNSIKDNLEKIKTMFSQELASTSFVVKTLKINIELWNRNFYNNPYQKFLHQPITELQDFNL